MKKITRTTLIVLLIFAFLYLGLAFVLTPIPSLDDIIILGAIRAVGVVWFIAGIWIVINIRKIHNDII